MTNINDKILEIFRYIKYEEDELYKLEREQDGYSDAAHFLEPDANKNYEDRLKYINAVQEMRRFRSGVMAHHKYVSGLQLAYMEMNNKLSPQEE